MRHVCSTICTATLTIALVAAPSVALISKAPSANGKNIVIATACGPPKLLRVDLGERLRLSYTQSLYRTLQEEHFTVEAGGLRLRAVSFGDQDSFEYYDSNPDASIDHEAGRITATFRNPKLYEEVVFRNAEFSDHEIHLSGETVNLAQAAPRGTLITLAVVPDGEIPSETGEYSACT